MKTRTIALLTASAGLCLAMTSLPAPDAQPGAAPTTRSADPQSTFDLNFGGGTVGQYLDSLAGVTTVNIVATEEVRALPMPAVRLRGVSAWASVELVESMFIDPSTGAVQMRSVSEEDSAPIYVLSVIFQGMPNMRPQPPAPSVNEIFSVGNVLRPASEEPSDLQVKKIFEMIDSAMTLAPADEKPELAFHDDTQMLVFRGSPEQRRLIESVLERYQQSWVGSAERARALRNDLAGVELEAQTSAIEAEAARGRVQHLMARLEELRQMHAAGNVSIGEIRSAEDEANQATADAQIQSARAEYARQQAEAIARQLSGLTASQEPTIVIYDFRGLGAQGDRVGLAFKALLDAAQFPGTEMSADGSGMVTLRASTTLHETMHYLLNHVRGQEAPRRPAPAGR